MMAASALLLFSSVFLAAIFTVLGKSICLSRNRDPPPPPFAVICLDAITTEEITGGTPPTPAPVL
jgi:hypothetical protein